jgi:hypothetical protein
MACLDVYALFALMREFFTTSETQKPHLNVVSWPFFVYWFDIEGSLFS